MIVAVLSDVHANLPALEAFVRATRGTADAYVCLGDVVGYGPWNDECLELVRALPGSVLLEGNHERLFLGRDRIEDELPLVQEFYEHSARSFSRRDLIVRLPVTYELGPFLCRHTIDGRRIYADTAVEVARDHFIGHTHHQFTIQRAGKTIVNCGSVGQNRRRIDALSYALYDTASGRVALCEEEYPLDRFLAELAARGYSHRCLEYYLRKRKGG